MRADLYLVEHGYAESRTKAQGLIADGCVFADGVPVRKASADLSGKEVRVTDGGLKYVGRGGLKLEHALGRFGVNPTGLRCIDIGASTGGFTDCLLQQGAGSVLCVDSGSDQLHSKLRADPRVQLLEHFNAKELDRTLTGGYFDLAVMDVSFISQTLLYPAVCRVLDPTGRLISLVKPQFEAGRGWIGKGGIVRRRAAHLSVLERIAKESALHGLYLRSVVLSPITGGDGNVEYLALFTRETPAKTTVFDFEKLIPEQFV